MRCSTAPRPRAWTPGLPPTTEPVRGRGSTRPRRSAASSRSSDGGVSRHRQPLRQGEVRGAAGARSRPSTDAAREQPAGFENLIKLASTAYLDGFYRRPRIDRDALREWERTSSSSWPPRGRVAQAILADDILSASSANTRSSSAPRTTTSRSRTRMPEEDQVTAGRPRARDRDAPRRDQRHPLPRRLEVQDVVLCIGTARWCARRTGTG